MFECPRCGGAIDTTPTSHFCYACDWFEPRNCVELVGIDGLSYPEAGRIPAFAAA
jgi:hypothetical protein